MSHAEVTSETAKGACACISAITHACPCLLQCRYVNRYYTCTPRYYMDACDKHATGILHRRLYATCLVCNTMYSTCSPKVANHRSTGVALSIACKRTLDCSQSAVGRTSDGVLSFARVIALTAARNTIPADSLNKLSP